MPSLLVVVSCLWWQEVMGRLADRLGLLTAQLHGQVRGGGTRRVLDVALWKGDDEARGPLATALMPSAVCGGGDGGVASPARSEGSGAGVMQKRHSVSGGALVAKGLSSLIKKKGGGKKKGKKGKGEQEGQGGEEQEEEEVVKQQQVEGKPMKKSGSMTALFTSRRKSSSAAAKVRAGAGWVFGGGQVRVCHGNLLPCAKPALPLLCCCPP